MLHACSARRSHIHPPNGSRTNRTLLRLNALTLIHSSCPITAQPRSFLTTHTSIHYRPAYTVHCTTFFPSAHTAPRSHPCNPLSTHHLSLSLDHSLVIRSSSTLIGAHANHPANRPFSLSSQSSPISSPSFISNLTSWLVNAQP